MGGYAIRPYGSPAVLWGRLFTNSIRILFQGGISMCLSTVYRGEKTPENIVMANVQSIEVQDGQLLLTDLMERQVVVVGSLVSVDLVGGTAVVRESVA